MRRHLLALALLGSVGARLGEPEFSYSYTEGPSAAPTTETMTPMEGSLSMILPTQSTRLAGRRGPEKQCRRRFSRGWLTSVYAGRADAFVFP